LVHREHEIRRIAEGFHFPEGPRWHEGKLYFSDFYAGKVYALEADESVTTFCAWTDWISGIGFTPDNDLLFVAVSTQKLMRYTAAGDFVEVVDLGRFVQRKCNDMLVDEAGWAYIGNFGFDLPPDKSSETPKPGEEIATTRLIVVSPDGQARMADGELVFPNGMARSPDGRTLIVAETFAGRLSAFDMGEDGSLTGHRVWVDFAGHDFATVAQALASGVPLPDGITVDAEGAVWLADVSGTGAIRVAPGGKILDRVATPGLTVFAVELGGEDLRTLYLCAAPHFQTHDPVAEKRGVLLATQVDVPGVPRATA
jgi:sugar lactone lactonase YvrE